MSTQQTLFVERPDEMWEFVGQTPEVHVECWQEIDGQVQKDKWKLSSIAASLSTKYNQKTIDNFAYETRRSARRIREYAQTWRAFENGGRAPILSFTHHVAAASADDPIKAIELAHDKEWSAHELKHWVATGIEPGQKKGKKDAPAASPELQKIHDDAVRAELDERMAAVRLWTEPVDPFLSDVYRRVVELLEWQRDRTVDRDCAAIITMLAGNDDDEDGTECASLGDMHTWLKTRCLLMSEQDLKARIETMLGVNMLQKLSRERSRGKTQRGAITGVYEVHPEYLDRMAEADDADKSHPTVTELLKAKEQPVPHAA